MYRRVVELAVAVSQPWVGPASLGQGQPLGDSLDRQRDDELDDQ
jgi:hypothetical protein